MIRATRLGKRFAAVCFDDGLVTPYKRRVSRVRGASRPRPRVVLLKNEKKTASLSILIDDRSRPEYDIRTFTLKTQKTLPLDNSSHALHTDYTEVLNTHIICYRVMRFRTII